MSLTEQTDKPNMRLQEAVTSEVRISTKPRLCRPTWHPHAASPPPVKNGNINAADTAEKGFNW
jgi:hypothetical protein